MEKGEAPEKKNDVALMEAVPSAPVAALPSTRPEPEPPATPSPQPAQTVLPVCELQPGTETVFLTCIFHLSVLFYVFLACK